MLGTIPIIGNSYEFNKNILRMERKNYDKRKRFEGVFRDI